MRKLWMVAMLTISCGGASIQPFGGSCSVALSGAQSGTYACTSGLGGYDTTSTRGDVAVGTAGSNPSSTVLITFQGEPHQGTFRSTDADAQSSLQVVMQGSSSSPQWFAGAGSGTTTGSYTLSLSSVAFVSQYGTTKAYAVSGTVDATLPAVSGSGATGTVTLHAAF